MKITVDIKMATDGTPIGVEYIDLDPLAPATVTGLKGTAVPVNQLAVIAALQADKTLLVASGWLAKTNIPGHPAGTTKWDILVSEANKPSAIPEVLALKLT